MLFNLMGKKNSNTKTFSLTSAMVGDIMFVLRPFKERQMEMMYWSERLKSIENDIVKSLGLEPDKWSCNWVGAYQSGKLVCTRIPQQKEDDKNEENKKK